jgi:hypothetical protein
LVELTELTASVGGWELDVEADELNITTGASQITVPCILHTSRDINHIWYLLYRSVSTLILTADSFVKS